MCDELTDQETEAFLSRRRFGALAAASAAASLLPAGAFAAELTESEVEVTTPDGTVDAYFVHPASAAPAVLLWPDIFGLRPAMRTLGKRLAAEGYAVLVVNPYYRQAKAPVVAEGDSLKDPTVRDKVFGLAGPLTAETTRRDAKAIIAWLDAQAAVDKARGIGTQGYCMGGPMVLWSAAEVPNRIAAAATFHGGGLVTDEADSPHLGIPKMKAQALIAVAKNDDEREPEAKNVLKQAFAKAALPAEIEVYEAMHGWCALDFPVYDEAQATKAWSRLLALYDKALRA